ncbi:hypothetical protein QT381_15475 [Galbitalea sp. SE-J8]|uniref:HAAS signaling domain-containing protein n=1 Tax=Galbitalea sp. SE-J8 TaxID=3054952 RepID=UPI00259CB565|nr:hypothetical protein [Galbitalea sp. SE-J8]MDM4764400.1 hypothetical protein [Galbitalea sp. SE-J8]
MTPASQLPIEARTWLDDVERRTAPLPDDDRRELLAGLAEHLAESLDGGAAPAEVLARLGSPRDIADQAFQQHHQQNGVDLRARYFNAKRVTQYVAAALALAAALAIALLPSYIQVSTTSDGQESITSGTVLEVVGIWFLLVLAIPLILAALPLSATGRAWQPLSIVSAVLLSIFALVGSLSIGWYFVPATIAAIVAVFLPRHPRTHYRRGA